MGRKATLTWHGSGGGWRWPSLCGEELVMLSCFASGTETRCVPSNLREKCAAWSATAPDPSRPWCVVVAAGGWDPKLGGSLLLSV